MPISARITPFDKTIDLLLDEALSPDARRQRIVIFAQEEIAKADRINAQAIGSVPPKTITVNGVQGAPLESADPDKGTIIVEYRLVGDVLIWIMQRLRDSSPVVSGTYRDSHTLYADGVEVSANEKTPLASEYIFINTTPYTRKIEFGLTKSGEPFVIQVDPHIYQRTASEAKARFGNVAKINYGFQSLANLGGTAIGRWSQTAGAHALAVKHGRRSNHKEWLTRVPAITVTLK